MSGLSPQPENIQESSESYNCDRCNKNPRRSDRAELCAECFECQDCGDNDSPRLYSIGGNILCEECLDERKNRPARRIERIRLAEFEVSHKPIDFDSLDDNQKKIASAYLGNPFGNLIINGGSGSGKTWTAVAIAKRLVEYKSLVKFISVPWMFSTIRDKIGRDEGFQITEFVSDLLKFDYLILDDIGAHRATDWAIETLYLILDRWEANGRHGLICTTNITMQEIAEKLSDRIASRLSKGSKIIKLDGVDKRLTGGRNG